MRIAYVVIHGIDLPRMPREGKELLQFSKKTRVGDQFIFAYHIVVRVYGFEGKPYTFPTFLRIRIMEMEYTRKGLLLDELHCGSIKQHLSFHIPKDVGPFDIISLNDVYYIEGFLEELSLEKDKAVAYDPYGVISNQRS